MLYNNKSELIQLLQQNGLYAQKNLGQNFLVNTQIIEKILLAAELKPTDQVIEIGPGIGLLTLELAKKAKTFITIEKDYKLYPHLEKILADFPNSTLIKADALDFQPTFTDYKIIANIPYYITSPLIHHYLGAAEHKPSSLTLLVQLEVAQKICAKPGDHTVLSLQTQVFAVPKIIAKVAPGNFHPAPQVDSAILQLTTLPQPQVSDFKLFDKIIKKAFSQKRKTLLNTLSTFHGADKALLNQKLPEIGISPQERPQNLSFADWQKLVDLFSTLNS